MDEKKKINHAVLIYMTVEEFFTEYVKMNDLSKTQIIIISRDVITDIKKKEQYNNITYSSKYDNVEFVPSLLPTPSSMEYIYGDDKTRFIEAYDSHLLSDESFSDLLCIADMVVNDGIDVILLSSRAEYASRFPYYLKEFTFDKFGLNICLSEELKEADTDEEYEACLNLGDIDDIKTLIDYNKKELTEGKVSAEEFFNRFMEDAPTKYRKILMTKDVEYLVSLGKDKGLRLSRRKPKESLVDTIVKEVFGSEEEVTSNG